MSEKIILDLASMGEGGSRTEREAFLKRCTLSVSGLRFIVSTNEESLSPGVPGAALDFVLCALDNFINNNFSGQEPYVVYIGRDSRPTGPIFLDLAARLFHTRGFEVRNLGCAPVPQIMAATHQMQGAAFCYFTASHNPPGHNGLKLGLADGAILRRDKAEKLIADINKNHLDDDYINTLRQEILQTNCPAEIRLGSPPWVEASRECYKTFVYTTVFGKDWQRESKALAAVMAEMKATVIFDMNGSSRLMGPDREMCNELGLRVKCLGAELGRFDHAIVPEGKSLKACCDAIDEMHEAELPLLGLVPDCDGDRGNLVLPIAQEAVALKAQETFALSVLSNVMPLVYRGEDKLAVVGNGPTSLRLDRLMSPLGVKVFRAEVGEANVLARTAEIIAEGYQVPLCGEGSNGGNITLPSTVRDPLMTLISLLRFAFGPDGSQWLAMRAGDGPDGSVLERLLGTLPRWLSTDAFDEEALMPVPSIEHEVLKSNYEKLLLDHFANQREYWQGIGVDEILFYSQEGTKRIAGPGGRPSPGKGGLSVILCSKGREMGFLWMRGSGTEPVFRVICDWGGDPCHYPMLISLHRALISQAASDV